MLRTALRGLLAIAALLVALAVPVPGSAQTAGTITGRVVDGQGAVVPGVTVTVSSPTLQGTRTTISQADGRFTVLGLPPGTYEVVAELQGFNTFRQPDVFLRVNQTLTLEIALEVAKLAEVVTVSADREPPIIDTVNPELAFNVSGDFVNQLALSSRRQWEQVWLMVPGVYVSPRSEADFDPDINGANQRNNTYKLDGFEIGSSFTNQGWTTQFSTEIIQDVEIVTGGKDASRPLGEGGFLNVVTRSGGNAFHGSGAYYMQPRRWNDNNIPGGRPLDQELFQPDVSLGGRILANRTWFFGSYRYFMLDEGIARSAAGLANFVAQGVDVPDYSREQRKHRGFGKVTQKIDDRNTVVITYLDDRGTVANSDSRDQSLQDSTIGITDGGPTVLAKWDTTLSPVSFLSVQYGYRRINSSTEIYGGDNPAVTRFGRVTTSAGLLAGADPLLYYGNRSGLAWYSEGIRDHHEMTADYTYVMPNWGGQHTLQAGLQWKPKTRADSESIYPATPGFIDEVRQVLPDGRVVYVPFRRQFRTPQRVFAFGGDTKLLDLYAQDTWQIRPNVSIKGGLRVDRQYASDRFGLAGIDAWSVDPRIAVAWRIGESGRDVLQVFAGRVTNLIYVQNSLFASGQQSATRTEYDLDLNGTWETVRETATVEASLAPTTQVDPDLGPSHVRDFYVRYTRQLPWRIQADISYINRRFSDFQGSENVNIVYENGRFVGYRDPAYDAINRTTNLQHYTRRYDSVQLSASRNFGRYWQAFGTYTWQRTVEDGEWRADQAERYLYPAEWFRDDRISPPHILRLNATAQVPAGRFGLNGSVMYSYQSGIYGSTDFTRLSGPDPALGPASVTLPNGRVVSNPLAITTRILEGRGNKQQTPGVSRVNLRVGVSTRFAGNQSIELTGMIFNVTNDDTPLAFLTGANDVTSVNYGRFSTSVFPPARGYQVGVIYRF